MPSPVLYEYIMCMSSCTTARTVIGGVIGAAEVVLVVSVVRVGAVAIHLIQRLRLHQSLVLAAHMHSLRVQHN